MLYLDLHSHSIASDDSRATVEQYLKWVQSLRGRGLRLDGFVLTEHRKFDLAADYSSLAQQHGTLVLKGSELDTRHGHFLVYGVTEALLHSVDFGDVHMDPFQLMEAAERTGAIAIPAHPGRAGIGLVEWIRRGVEFPGLRIVEGLNGNNRPAEAEAASRLVEEYGFLSIGGSDAHFVSSIGRCVTRFPDGLRSEGELAEALRAGEFAALPLQETGKVAETALKRT